MTMTTGCSILQQFNKPKNEKTAQTTVSAEPVTVSETTAAAPDYAAPLAGEWAITEVGGKSVVINGEDHPKLTLEPVKSEPSMLNVIAFNGCNYLNGVWNIKENAISAGGEFLSSLKACADAPYEYDVNQAINQATRFELTTPTDLSLKNESGVTLMKLHKNSLAFLNGAWRVTSIEGTPITANAKLVIDTDELRLHGNGGCNVINGEITVNLDKPDAIEFKNIASSRMMCPDIAVEQTLLLALENVDTAAPGADPDQALLKNISGQTVITLQRLAPGELADE